MDVKRYQQWVKDTLDIPHVHTSRQEALIHFVLGLNGECGEVTEIIKKTIFGGKLPQESIDRELGDVLWYLTALCCSLDISLEDVMDTNYHKLVGRYKLYNKRTCNGCVHKDPQDIDLCMNASARIENKGCDYFQEEI